MTKETMKAAVIQELHAAPIVVDVPRPQPREGEALVRVDVAALQPVELSVAAGRFFGGRPTFPYIPGLEAVGTVVESATTPRGTRVRVEIVHPGYGRDGCFAEYVTVPDRTHATAGTESTMVPVPDGLDPVVVAAIGSTGQTARLLVDRAQSVFGTLEGASVLVLGATGVVGEVLVQLCRAAGARRIVAAGRKRDRLDYMTTIGADAAVQLPAEVAPGASHALTEEFVAAAGGQIDVVFDPLWGVFAAAALDGIADGGLLVNFGQSAAPRAALSGVPLRARRVTIIGQAGARSTPDERLAATNAVLQLVADGAVKLTHEVVPLAELPDAWRRQAEGPGGKLVIRPDHSDE